MDRASVLRQMSTIERNLQGDEDPARDVLLEAYRNLLREMYGMRTMMNMDEVKEYRARVAWYVENGGVFG